MTWVTEGAWLYGPTWVDTKGKKTYYIRERRGGIPYRYSTRCGTVIAAKKEYDRFCEDPAGYRPLGSEAQLLLTDVLIASYVVWCQSAETPPSKQHLREKERLLGWWKGQLTKRPLPSVATGELLKALDGQPNRTKKIVAIKHLYTYLRERDLIETGDDPTLEKLRVPQAKVAQDDDDGSKVIDEKDYAATLPHLPSVTADICRLGASLGCHVSETLRFAKAGKVEVRKDGTGVLGFPHKNGHYHRVVVDAETLDVAQRLRASKMPSYAIVFRRVRQACLDAGIPAERAWKPGWFRHTFATRAIERGEAVEAIAARLGHDVKTMLKRYGTRAARPMMQGMAAA